MAVYIGSSKIKSISTGGGAISAVYSGSTKVFPSGYDVNCIGPGESFKIINSGSYSTCYIEIYSDHYADACYYELTYTQDSSTLPRAVFTYEGYEGMQEPVINISRGTYSDGRITYNLPYLWSTIIYTLNGEGPHDFHVCFTFT